METTDLIKKVRKIEIKTKGLSRQVFSGQYNSAFKGRGMAFTEVREYRYGDDIRSIDWNVTARLNHPYVKVFDEEREMTVMLLIDVSGSHNFGTASHLKKEMITEIAGVLAFSAIQNNDKVGVIFFSDRIEKFIPPQKGTQHILRIIRELIQFTPEHTGTDLTQALRYMRNIIKKRSVAFLLSDFYDRNFSDALSIVSRKHDLVCLRIYDQRERMIPDMGLIKVRDAESGQVSWMDSSDRRLMQYLQQWNMEHDKYIREAFARASVDSVEIPTHGDYVPPLMQLFRQRTRQRIRLAV